MIPAEKYAKVVAWHQYVRARKLAEHNRGLSRKEFEVRLRTEVERLETEYPDFAEAFRAISISRAYWIKSASSSMDCA